MSRHDYAKLDAGILACISAGSGTPLTFTRLCNLTSVRGESQMLATEANATKPPRLHIPSWRIVDRRLQALRKAGRIRYQRKPEGWVLATPPEAGAEA